KNRWHHADRRESTTLHPPRAVSAFHRLGRRTARGGGPSAVFGAGGGHGPPAAVALWSRQSRFHREAATSSCPRRATLRRLGPTRDSSPRIGRDGRCRGRDAVRMAKAATAGF